MTSNSLAFSFRSRCNPVVEIDGLNRAIELGREALSLCPQQRPDRSIFLIKLASYLSARYRRHGEINDITEAIVLANDALSLCTPGHRHQAAALNTLAFSLCARYDNSGKIEDLDDAIKLTRDALSVCAPSDPNRRMHLKNLASYLCTWHNRLNKLSHLNKAIIFEEDAPLAFLLRHPDRPGSLDALLSCLFNWHDQLKRLENLTKAIVLAREALSLYPPGYPDRSKSLDSLANILLSRYRQLGGMDDLDQAIVLAREALSLRPPGHPDRLGSFKNLANILFSRYQQLGEINDLNEAIFLVQDALSLHPPGHPDRSGSLNNLANILSSRFQQLGWVDDLNEAIVLAREALSLRPPGHLARSGSLNNLANILLSRYRQLGGMDDLNAAIVLARDALSLLPPGHPDRSGSLNDLANNLSSRYQQLGGIDDMNEAIVLAREALSLRPPGHPDRSGSLNDLANNLSSRYQQLGGIDDMNEAIVLAREALSLRPPGHPDRSGSLNNLANILSSRFQQLGRVDDLNEAIVLAREALSLRPPGHADRSGSLNNLASILLSRYRQLEGMDDLNEAVVLARDALSLRPPGHPDWSGSLNDLACHLLSQYELMDRIGDLSAASLAKQEAFRLYVELGHDCQSVSPGGLFAAKAWINAAEKFHHPSTLFAYETALRLLGQHLVALPTLPHHLGVLKSLSSSLAVDAFSACLRYQSPTKAVELLEQGRALFWSQLIRLRPPLDDAIEWVPQGKFLADEFTRLSSLIRNALNSPGPDQHDQVCYLNFELEKVVSKIRELPSLSRFLLPSLFSDLQRAASDGPVIIMNASEYSCDALVVFSNKDPIHIPLPVTKKDVVGLSLRLLTLTEDAKRKNMDDKFKLFLRELWDKLVSHIVNVLQSTTPHNSRIWWCPTAEFSLLPLHAASPYKQGQKGLSDLYVSSYTITLTALIRARRLGLPYSLYDEQRFAAIGQATPKDKHPLLYVAPELDTIGWLVDGLTTFTRIEEKDACISIVADELGKNNWAHLACSGVPNQERPFESAFALDDGPLTIQHISQCDFQNAVFAYLSVSHTTVGDKENLDEAIHLVAAMQFAGFRSVIGTMGSVDDSLTNKVVSEFYKLMVDDSGRLDYTRAARALRVTMRKVDIPMDQRILYQHFGA